MESPATTGVLSKEPSFKNQPPTSPIARLTSRIAAFGPNNEVFVSGSCVRIAKNLYLTARHVMVDHLQRFGHVNGIPNFNVWVVHVRDEPEYSIWDVDRLWLSPHSDLAIFHTKPYNDIASSEGHVPVVVLDLRPPAIGHRIVGFGYHSAAGRIRFDEHGTKHIEIDADGAATLGEVRDVHELRRDQRLNFPCYQANARFDGSMSGGPVMNDRGHVCGIICSSLPSDDPNIEHVCYAATLWPLMGIAIDIATTGEPQDRFYPLLDLARNKVIAALGWEQVVVRETSTPTLYEVSLRQQTAI
ncbi:MAG: S1 family peptidase [Methyloceanibacter sp.]